MQNSDTMPDTSIDASGRSKANSSPSFSSCLRPQLREPPRPLAVRRRVGLLQRRVPTDAPDRLKLDLTSSIDPNAPKRGLSAYMFFANEQRENVREENPGITFGQVGKLLGERWKALNEKQRAPYEAKAAADKKRYEDEKQAYNVGAS